MSLLISPTCGGHGCHKKGVGWACLRRRTAGSRYRERMVVSGAAPISRSWTSAAGAEGQPAPWSQPALPPPTQPSPCVGTWSRTPSRWPACPPVRAAVRHARRPAAAAGGDRLWGGCLLDSIMGSASKRLATRNQDWSTQQANQRAPLPVSRPPTPPLPHAPPACCTPRWPTSCRCATSALSLSSRPSASSLESAASRCCLRRSASTCARVGRGKARK